MPLPAAAAALLPSLKALAIGGGKKALMGAAKQGAKSFVKDKVKDKAKDFVTGKNRKKKGKKGALVKSKGGQVTQGGEQERGGALVPTTPMVGSYRVETPPDKPDTEGKQSRVSFESINNQLESIVALTEVLKKTSQAKLKTADNRRKAERKASEKAKKRQRESLLEKTAGFLGNKVVDAAKKAAPFDPLKFFTMIFLGSLLMWIMNNGSKIIAALKITLAFINNLPKLLMAGFNTLKEGLGTGLRSIGKLSPRLIKLARGTRNALRGVGSKLSKAFRSIGTGIKNLAKGIIKKLKDLGKFMMEPFGGKKPPKGTPKGITKLAQSTSTASTASKTSGTLTNAGRLMQTKHGDEAARMYQGLIDNGMKPSKAAQNVNKAIKAGKLTSQPAAKAATGAGSKVAQKAGQKSILKVTKKGLGFLKRIPVVGSLLTLVVSLLGGDPISQALFKTGGAGIGGFLGTFIPIPVVGTVLGELVGEYVGDLFYHLIMGGGPEAVGQKLQDDIKSAFETGSKVVGWFRDGFGRMYDGLPKINILGWEGLINFPALMINPLQVIPTLYKAFFTRDPMNKGKETTADTGTETSGVTNMSTVTTVKPERAGDFVVNSAGQLRVFDGQGYAAATPEQQKLYESGATNIDGTRSTPKPKKMMTETEYHNARVEDYSLPDTYEEYVSEFTGTSPQTPTSAGADKWKPLLDLIAAGESDSSGGYDAMNPSRNTRTEGNPITQMTMRQVRDMAMKSSGTGAAGRYQIMPAYNGVNVFKKLVEDVGLDYDTSLFTPENQDKMGVYRLAVTRHGNDWLAGKISDDTFGLGISMEWAALKSKSGGYYDHQKRNKSTIGYNKVLEAMNKIKGQPQQPVKPQTPMAEPPSPLEGKGQTGIVTPATTKTPQGTTTTPQTTPSIAPTGTGLTNVVPVENLQSIGAGTGEVGMTSGRGMRKNPVSGKYKHHAGVDIGTSGKKGYYVAFKLKGKVSDVGTFAGYGKTVIITSGGKDFLFAHLAKTMVTKGQAYNGEIIGEIGNTGAGTGEHLHFEVSPAGTGGYGKDEDPMPYVKYLAIGKMGDGSSVGTSDTTPNVSIQDPASQSTPSGSVTPGQKSSISTPAAIRPGQTPSPVSDISQQLAYETTGGTTILMHPSGRQSGGSVGGGRSGTPVIMGSGDVVNSYYKSQLLGFLYKQG